MERSIQVRSLCVFVLTFLAGTGIIVPALGGQKGASGRGTRSFLLSTTSSSTLSVSVVNLAASAPLTGAAATSLIDLGAVSYGGSHTAGVTIKQRKSSFVVGTTFGLQINDSSSQARFATVMAYISGPPSPLIYRIDGKTLGSAPVLVAPRNVVGSVSRHRLEIEIPNSVTERNAQQQAAVQFEVMPN